MRWVGGSVQSCFEPNVRTGRLYLFPDLNIYTTVNHKHKGTLCSGYHVRFAVTRVIGYYLREVVGSNPTVSTLLLIQLSF